MLVINFYRTIMKGIKLVFLYLSNKNRDFHPCILIYLATSASAKEASPKLDFPVFV